MSARTNQIILKLNDDEVDRWNAAVAVHAHKDRSDLIRAAVEAYIGTAPASVVAAPDAPEEPLALEHPFLEPGTAPIGFYLKFDQRHPHNHMLPYVIQVAQKIIDREHRLAMDMDDLIRVAFLERNVPEQPGHRDDIAISMRQLGFEEHMIRAGQPRGAPRRLYAFNLANKDRWSTDATNVPMG